LHPGADRAVRIGDLHPGDKDALIGLDLALRTDDGYFTPESLQWEALKFDGGGFAAPQ
jgi:hypothetical protein